MKLFTTNFGVEKIECTVKDQSEMIGDSDAANVSELAVPEQLKLIKIRLFSDQNGSWPTQIELHGKRKEVSPSFRNGG